MAVSLPQHGRTTQELMSEALMECYASACEEHTAIFTVEINHRTFTTPVRIARWTAATPELKRFRCVLEENAPHNPGETVIFTGMPFEVKFPDKVTQNAGEFEFKCNGIGYDLEEYLEMAVLDGTQITAIVRVYLLGEELNGPGEIWPDIELKNPKIEATTGNFTMQGSMFNWINRTFGYNYTPGKYPALVGG